MALNRLSPIETALIFLETMEQCMLLCMKQVLGDMTAFQCSKYTPYILVFN